MSKTLYFEIPFPLVPKERARTVRRNGKARTFTPSRTWKFERDVAVLALAARPQRWSISARYGVTIMVNATRGDVDNYAKSILDAMQGVAYAADSQVDDLRVARVSSIPSSVCVTRIP